MLESLRFSKQVMLLKIAQKADILPHIVQRVDELTVFSNATFINDLLKSLMVKSIICVGEPVDRHLNGITSEYKYTKVNEERT